MHVAQDTVDGSREEPPAPELRLDSSRGRLVVAAMVSGSTVTFISATVVNVALPRVAADLGASLVDLQWIVNGYLLALAALVLPAGSAGDIFGRRRVFQIGVAVFAAGSLAAALAPTSPSLIGARIVQGVGAAAMTPASLAIIDASFHRDDRSRAVGVWASGSALAASLGPFVGGYLVDAVSWRLIFAVPLPLAAAAAFLAARCVPETRDDALGRHLDLPGTALGIVAIGGLVLSLVQGPADGWTDPLVLAAAAAAVVGSVAFVVSQGRRRDPMLPLRLFGDRQFSGANLYTLLVYFAVGGSFFFTAIYFQTVLGYSALAAGAALVPMNLVMLVGSPKAGALSARIGPRWLLTVGPLLMAGGLLVLGLVASGDDYLGDVLPGVLLLGVGLATMVAPLTAAVFAAVADRDVGIASAVNNAVARTGGLMATAALPFLAGAGTDIAGGDFGDAYQRALLIAAGLCVIAAAIAAANIGRCVDLHTAHQPSPTVGAANAADPTGLRHRATS